MLKNSNSENILGFQVSKETVCESISRIVQSLDHGGSRHVFVCANPHSLVEADNDRKFQQAIREADMVIPDGVGIVLASKILGGSIGERVTGSDIFSGLSAVLNQSGGRNYFFLGSTEKTLAAIREKMAREYPNIRFAGSFSPPFKAEFSAEESRIMVEAINSAAPDVLWVGMTAPKQEKWIHQHRDQLNVKFIGAIGAVFDFYTGNIKRSHPLFQKYGLEWLPRLIQEPRRLFRRNFISSPLFLLRVFGQRFGK